MEPATRGISPTPARSLELLQPSPTQHLRKHTVMKILSAPSTHSRSHSLPHGDAQMCVYVHVLTYLRASAPSKCKHTITITHTWRLLTTSNTQHLLLLSRGLWGPVAALSGDHRGYREG